MASGSARPTRYETLFKLASGGMATVYVGTARGAMGFWQVVAIKEPHPHLLDDKSYRRELIAEARLASMIHHANVVDVRDVEASSRTIRLVMDYIEGASFGELLVMASKAGRRLPPGIVVRVALDACAGLHAAHELVDEKGRKIGLVHRDVSPQNLLVGLDGTTRVSDFGVAKATAASVTASGTLKGKIAYMAPEYLEGRAIDRRVDVFGLGVVVWEALAGKRLFRAQNEVETVQRVMLQEAPPISQELPELGTHFDAALAMALAKRPEERFATAQAFAAALEESAKRAGALGSHSEVAALVAELAGPSLEARRMQLRARLAQESGVLSLMGAPPPSLPQSSPAPSTKPEDSAAKTLIDAPPLHMPPPEPAAPTPVLTPIARSTEPIVAEVSASRFDVEAAGVPKARSGIVPVAGAVLLLAAVGVGVAFVAFRGSASRAKGSEVPTTSPSPSPSPSTSTAASEEVSAAPLAPLSPLSTATSAHAAHTTPPARPTSAGSSATRPQDGPPPNPY